jgi:flavodoxin I
MKALIVYDSRFGNTEKIARAIGEAIPGEVEILRPGEANPTELGSIDLLIVGSPTWGGRPTNAMREFLGKIPANALKNISVASFDTRDKSILTRPLGYAAGRIANSLINKGGTLIVPPEGFVVKGLQGPLGDGELERAAGWAKGILASKN